VACETRRKQHHERVTRRTKKKFPRMSDPIRIVPLHLPNELYRAAAGIAAPPAAQLAYRGGPSAAQLGKSVPNFLGTGVADKSELRSRRPGQPVFQVRALSISFTFRRELQWCRVDLVPASRSAAITTPSEAVFTTP
jgi:hypothetical protein